MSSGSAEYELVWVDFSVKSWQSPNGEYVQRPNGLHNREIARLNGTVIKSWRAPNGTYAQRPNGLHNKETFLPDGVVVKDWRTSCGAAYAQRTNGKHNEEIVLPNGMIVKNWRTRNGAHVQRPNGMHNEEMVMPDGTVMNSWLSENGEMMECMDSVLCRCAAGLRDGGFVELGMRCLQRAFDGDLANGKETHIRDILLTDIGKTSFN